MQTPLTHGSNTVQSVFLGWGESQSLVEVAEVITAQIQQFLRLDRVVIYQFDPEYNGQVIAEACDQTRLPALIGLHFPASDIPPQARAFFLKSRQRLIVDVASKHKTILSADEASSAKPFQRYEDVRYAQVDPCHLQYLLGMGVLSSITFSIVHQGKLWGLLVGHHSDPRQFAEAEIQTVQLWVDQLSVALAQDVLRQQVQQHQNQEQLLNKLTILMGQDVLTADVWQKTLQVVAEGLKAEGCRLYLLPDSLAEQAIVYTYGIQPAAALESEDMWLNFCNSLEPIEETLTITSLEMGHCQTLTSTVDQWQTQPQGALLTELFQPVGISSVLVVPLYGQDRAMAYLSFYRQEASLEILWAGQHSHDPRNQRPRASFATWREQRHHARPWQPPELDLAQIAGRHLYMGLMQHWVKTQIHLRSAHDVMTQLPNWVLFNQQLHLSILQCLQQGKALAVAILNLDQFKRINTTYGHTFGNYLLKSVAHRLRDCLQHELHREATDESWMLARWHGDKFAMLLPASGGKEKVNRYAQAVLDSLQRPFCLQGEEIYLTASLGVAVAPYDGNTTDALVQHAEVAMYQAKRHGHGSYLIYSPVLGAGDSLSYQMLANDLYRALTQQELVLYYQPQADLRTGRVTGVEVLVRWQHPQLGLVPPDRFIPIAEETGLIGRLDEWVLRTACLQYRQWRQAGLPPIRLAVNLSATQFESAGLVKLVKGVLQDAEMQAAELELEITEETVTRDIRRAVVVLNQLKEMGIKIALDDFGTGYSSLNVLKHFPVDTLKIDKSFVRDCPQNQQDAAIVQTIVALGHGLNLNVVAEGVETPEHVVWLRTLACDFLQGYYLSRPQPADTIYPWLSTQPHCLLDSELISAPNGEDDRAAYLPDCVEMISSQTCPLVIRDQFMEASASAAEPSPVAAVSVSSMAAALQPSRMHHQLQREQLIRSITEKIRQSLHIEDILSTIVEEVRHLLKTDRVILYQFGENWEGHVVQESASPEYPSLLGLWLEDKCFPAEYVKYYRQGRVRAIEDIYTAEIADCHREMLSGLQVRANLILPVAYQDQLWGLLIAHQCRGPRQWQQDELELLGQLAVQSAIAIHQGELYQKLEVTNRELQKLSVQDSLTRVANRHQFDRKLHEEWHRLKILQAPLSLILCDIDYFKQYNDTYGHLAGDLCLQKVAKVLLTAVQHPGDLVARYGGEEFVILLPETDLAEAWLVAERIQQALDEIALPHSSSPIQRVTLSLGIACQVPVDQAFPSELVQRADDQLYAAKAAGRNQIKAAQPLQ